jgi:hypothetical protein
VHAFFLPDFRLLFDLPVLREKGAGGGLRLFFGRLHDDREDHQPRTGRCSAGRDVSVATVRVRLEGTTESTHVRNGQYGPPVMLVARCEVTYSGRLSTVLPDDTRLLMFKEEDGVIVVRKRAG